MPQTKLHDLPECNPDPLPLLDLLLFLLPAQSSALSLIGYVPQRLPVL